jgi:hypothetical protein
LSDDSRRAVELAERYADRGMDEEEWLAAQVAADDAAHLAWALWDEGQPQAAEAVGAALADDPRASAVRAADYASAAELAHTNAPAAWTAHQRRLADLLREVVGDPFRPPRPDPAWLAWNVGTIPKLAHTIYAERAFEQMPILADALEEAGCDRPEILRHCRESGEHVRGCWVVDLLLGKS